MKQTLSSSRVMGDTASDQAPPWGRRPAYIKPMIIIPRQSTGQATLKHALCVDASCQNEAYLYRARAGHGMSRDMPGCHHHDQPVAEISVDNRDIQTLRHAEPAAGICQASLTSNRGRFPVESAETA
jgi:hypothetical protein